MSNEPAIIPTAPVPAVPEISAVEEAMGRAKNESLKALTKHAAKAVTALTELVDLADSESVRLAAATKLLALIGVTEVKESKTVNLNLDAANIDADVGALMDRLRKNVQGRADVIQTTATETETPA